MPTAVVTPAVPAPPAAGRASTAAMLIGAAIGAAFLLWLSGLRPLRPTETGWVMRFDWVPHYFNWYYFRIEPWHWPPGRVEGYYAPLGTAIGLTDSIPLAAYLLKPFSAWLPADFQYLGSWWLLSYTLQGAVGARVVGRFTSRAVIQVLGAALFVLIPHLLHRVQHAALMSHWLLLWTLLIATREPARRAHAGEWALLGLLCGTIQPYLAGMVLPLLVAVTLSRPAPGLGPRLRALAAAVASTAFGWWISGLFILGEDGALAAGGLGYFSTNLLAPITPSGWSQLLPDIPVAGEGQLAEGFQYLGAGLLALIVVAAVLAWQARRASDAPAPLWPRPVLWVTLAMAAFAVSPVVTFGSHVLIDLDGPWAAPLATFRSSGRFWWPLTYLWMTWAIVTVARRAPRAAPWLLAAAVVVQLYDLHAIHLDRRAATHSEAFYAWVNPFVSQRWSELAASKRHLVLAPPPQCGTPAVELSPAIRFAVSHRLSVNSGVLSRHEERARARYCEGLKRDLAEGRLDPESLYVLPAPAAAALQAAAPTTVRCEVIDGVDACVAATP